MLGKPRCVDMALIEKFKLTTFRARNASPSCHLAADVENVLKLQMSEDHKVIYAVQLSVSHIDNTRSINLVCFFAIY